MSSFFTLPTSQRKRKRAEDAGRHSKRRGQEDIRPRSSKKTTRAQDPERDSSISGSDSDNDAAPEVDFESFSDTSDTSAEDEDPADRRVRLAQRYLDNIRGEVDEAGFDAEEIDKDLIAQRLKEDADEAKGRQFRLIAKLLDFGEASQTEFRMNTQSTTGVAVRPPYAYTVSKDTTLIKWEIVAPNKQQNGAVNGDGDVGQNSRLQKRRPKQLALVRGVKINASASQQHGHTDVVLSLAASPDGRYLATGSRDKKLIIWSADDLTPLKTFPSHRDAVAGLAFAPSSLLQPGLGAQLFSASMDRTLKTYSLNGIDSLAYVETLFGHQDHVLAVASMGVDQCVSVGARDRTARLWKVVEETQLVFRADSGRSEVHSTGSVDCVAALPPAHFVTGSDSGALSLWSVHKKKPLFTVQAAHGVEVPEPMEKVTSEADLKVIAQLKKDDQRRPVARGITALASVPGTDVVVSGSWDGWVRVWKTADDKRSMVEMASVGQGTVVDSHDADGAERVNLRRSGPARGVINSLAVFERRKEIANEFGGKKEGECQGLCIVAGTGKEMRLGRWRKFENGKNGAMVFEVPLAPAT